jgi:hypothetical protein
MLTLRRTKSALALRAFAGCAVAMPMTPSVAAMQASGDKVQQVAAIEPAQAYGYPGYPNYSYSYPYPYSYPYSYWPPLVFNFGFGGYPGYGYRGYGGYRGGYGGGYHGYRGGYGGYHSGGGHR